MKDGKKSDQNCDNTQDLQNGLKLQSNYSKYAIVMTLPVDWALEWLVAVGYYCSRHVAEACGMPDASPLLEWTSLTMGKPRLRACREHAGYAGTKGGFRD